MASQNLTDLISIYSTKISIQFEFKDDVYGFNYSTFNFKYSKIENKLLINSGLLELTIICDEKNFLKIQKFIHELKVHSTIGHYPTYKYISEEDKWYDE